MPSRLLLVALILLLPACGFHLRGNSQIADRYNPLFVVEGQLEPAQLIFIRKELKKSAARLVDYLDGSNQLQVLVDQIKSREIASSNTTDVKLLQLEQSIQFSVQSKSGEYLLQPRKLTQNVEVELDNANVLGYEQIIKTASSELQQRLFRIMISHLRY